MDDEGDEHVTGHCNSNNKKAEEKLYSLSMLITENKLCLLAWRVLLTVQVYNRKQLKKTFNTFLLLGKNVKKRNFCSQAFANCVLMADALLTWALLG